MTFAGSSLPYLTAVIRLAEVIGLTASDVHLDVEVPLVRLSEHPWRRLKTHESERDVPLVGTTLWG